MIEKNVVFTIDDFKQAVVPLIEEGLTVPLTVTGGSMTPYLSGGRDTVMISKPAFPLKVGDIAFFERPDGQIVMHRVKKRRENNYFFVGDAQTAVEGPVPEERVFGSVERVIRKGKIGERGSFTWFFFSKIWIRIIPLRPLCMKIYRAIKK